MKFKNNVAIVTGGSRGIGLGIVEAFINEGATVIVASRNEPDAKNNNIHFIKTDVRREKDIKALVNKVVRDFGKIDIVVNNAGIYLDENIDTMSLDLFRDIMDTNFTSTFMLTKELAPHLKKTGGNIINIGSRRGLQPLIDGPIYAAAKAAVINFTKGSALVYAKDGIRINCICPGPIDTEGVGSVFDNKDELREFLISNPLRKIGTPGDVAKLAVFLASEDASFITGGIYTVDGGSSLI
ncbi:MAG: hypothetical protein A3B23_00915 [Candidatus Colwellbacteria bacterium RIFCSPLOWO2_01_FULL_48_10]|uniref:Short-chain dehydrogenase n=1 Tax=Candidatus Colwellbacteria bacterium RIFCSPLOWO2_01_FULL_48_10 TaxID=1797690 RepID=A0A1G1Z639_9BACT|nr:MAG: hypothetical protein A3B23_00915 [Candidatus Colwellbacteria bacterium RIFCSPLOWO2_01_FULL_48_10]